MNYDTPRQYLNVNWTDLMFFLIPHHMTTFTLTFG